METYYPFSKVEGKYIYHISNIEEEIPQYGLIKNKNVILPFPLYVLHISIYTII